MNDTEALIDKILNLEWTMFQKVKGETPASCQQMPDKFKKIRGSLFSVWSQEALASYLTDLQTAIDQDVNFLTQKYALMDSRIPPLKTEPEITSKIKEIVAIETEWQNEIQQKFPVLFKRMGRSTKPTGDGSNFSIYLACELETYSENTINLYYLNITTAVENQTNLAVESLRILLNKEGYDSIDHAERYLAQHKS
jgi:Protein of unknown function (DUF4125)